MLLLLQSLSSVNGGLCRCRCTHAPPPAAGVASTGEDVTLASTFTNRKYCIRAGDSARLGMRVWHCLTVAPHPRSSVTRTPPHHHSAPRSQVPKKLRMRTERPNELDKEQSSHGLRQARPYGAAPPSLT